MNITKTIATEVANKLLENKTLAMKEAKDKVSAAFDKIYLSRIPKEVLNVFEKHKEFIKSGKDFQLQGNGFDWNWVQTSKELPKTKNAFQPNEEEAKSLLVLINTFEALVKEKRELLAEIETSLSNLKTYKRIQDNFPEAFTLLPSVTENRLTINLSELRNKIK